MRHNPYASNALGAYCGKRGSFYAPSEVENEYRSENDIGAYGDKGAYHGFFRVAGGTHQVVKPYEHIAYGSAVKNNSHEFSSIAYCLVGGSEKIEYLV